MAGGNARYDVEKGEPVCQHGPLECQFNKVLSCAMAAYPMQDDWFPFVECLEGAIVEASKSGSKIPDVITTASACAVHAGIVSRKLVDCYNGKHSRLRVIFQATTPALRCFTCNRSSVLPSLSKGCIEYANGNAYF